MAEIIWLDLDIAAIELLRGFGEVTGVGEEEKRQCDGVLELSASVFVKKTAGSVSHMCTAGSFREKRTHQFFSRILKRCNRGRTLLKYFLYQQEVVQTVDTGFV